MITMRYFRTFFLFALLLMSLALTLAFQAWTVSSVSDVMSQEPGISLACDPVIPVCPTGGGG